MTLEAEYEALAERSGFFLLDRWSVIRLTGADRQSFLQNMCTNDVKKLAVGQSCEAFLTDVKGKVHAHVFVLQGEEQITLLTVPDQAPGIIASLDRYIIREDVQLADDTGSYSLLLVVGSGAAELLKQLSSAEGDGMRFDFPFPGREAYLVLSDANIAHDFQQRLSDAGAFSLSAKTWDTLRVEAGFPLFGVDFNSEHLPQEIARDAQAISFTKGCYLGQETVARLDALGHVNKQLVTVKFPADSDPEPGVSLKYQDKEVGEATSVARSPGLGAPIGIAMIRREANAVGTTLDSPVGPVEVIATPAVG